MTCNLGKLDRAARGLVGICAISAGVYFQNWWGIVGMIPLSSATFAWCPVYVPFGISTCKTG